MKVLIVNAILYTSEQKKVKKVNSIKDTMIYDLCVAFTKKGHDVTLTAADDYKPLQDEKYPFQIIWMKSYFKSLFPANKFPYNRSIKKVLKENTYDLIICSEVFSLDTLLTVLNCKYKERIIIWQEMAFHQKMARQMASKVWHNIIVRNIYKNIRIVPRTSNAQEFISQYSSHVSKRIIPHGINLDKFKVNEEKTNTFVVCSQLIKRKRIDKSILAFRDFVRNNHNDYILYIIGDGDERENLEKLVEQEKLKDYVIFTGKLQHPQMISYLNTAKAMLVYTEKDNSMISIAESIAVATPVLTTSVPDNSTVIEKYGLGIVDDDWNRMSLETIVESNSVYVSRCIQYRYMIDNERNVDQFIEEVCSELP